MNFSKGYDKENQESFENITKADNKKHKSRK